MWSAIPVAERQGIDSLDRITAEVDLDGAPPAEGALGVNLVRDYGEGESKSLLWIMRCSAGVWTVLGRRNWGIDESWSGFYDHAPGIAVLRAETIAGAARPFLRVETVDTRGGVDPRYLRRQFDLLHLVDGELVTAFSCETHYEEVAGPDRATVYDRLRVVTYRTGTPPTIRVRVSGADGDRPRHRIASADYVFDGREFRTTEDVCH